MPHDDAGLSRRQILRRGVAVGTAVWTVPTVTAITLTPANAASPSGEPPTQPPKPPATPPEQPTDTPTPPPSSETPTTPPEQPPGTGTPKPPHGETSTPSPKPTPRPTGSAAPPGDDDTTAGGGLPNTGPGDVAQALGVGGLLTAAGAAMYVASRKESPEPGDAQPGATA